MMPNPMQEEDSTPEDTVVMEKPLRRDSVDESPATEEEPTVIQPGRVPSAPPA
jgi:hypothetical protein